MVFCNFQIFRFKYEWNKRNWTVNKIKQILLKKKFFFSSVQMRLYGLHKRQFVVIFIIFFICLFSMILIGIAGPSIIQSIGYKTENPPERLVN